MRTMFGDERRKRDLKQRLAALEREAAECAEKGEALAQAIAWNNIGAVHADLKDWKAALAAYERSAGLVPADATIDERATPYGNAAAAARRLGLNDQATLHGVWVDALAAAADSEAQRQVATGALALVRKAVGKDAFAPLLDAAIAQLPEELRAGVRRDEHADPTYRAAKDPA